MVTNTGIFRIALCPYHDTMKSSRKAEPLAKKAARSAAKSSGLAGVDDFDASWGGIPAALRGKGTLPSPWRERAEQAGTQARARLVADYIAGMTDRFALDEHKRLFDLYE